MHRRLAIALAIGVIVMIAGSSTAYAAHWSAPAGQPAQLCFVNAGLPPQVVPQAQAATYVWNRSTTGLNVTWQKCAPGSKVISLGLGPMPDGALAVTETHATGEGPSDLIMDAQTRYDADQIAYFASFNGAGLIATWRGTFCHEMGHALGLPHSQDPQSCMETNIPKPILMPAASDVAQLRSLYGGVGKTDAQANATFGLKVKAPIASTATSANTVRTVEAVDKTVSTSASVPARRTGTTRAVTPSDASQSKPSASAAKSTRRTSPSVINGSDILFPVSSSSS